MNQEQLQEVLRRHALWLERDSFGKRAELRGVSLTGVVLKEVDLSNADLRDVDLTGANLEGVNLRASLLRGANLERASLYGANLLGADLDGAKLPPGYGTLGQVGERYIVNWSPEKIFIGFEAHSREEWLGFTDHEIEAMGRGVLPWWQAQKDKIISAYDTSQTQGELMMKTAIRIIIVAIMISVLVAIGTYADTILLSNLGEVK